MVLRSVDVRRSQQATAQVNLTLFPLHLKMYLSPEICTGCQLVDLCRKLGQLPLFSDQNNEQKSLSTYSQSSTGHPKA